MLAKALAPLLVLLAGSAQAAKTDLAGCTLTVVPLLTEIVTTTVNGVVSSYGNYAQTTFQWDGTEQCQLIDCGGGRAPPKTDAPGCPLYTGTDTVPSLPFPTASLTLNAAAASSTTASSASSATAGATATPGASGTPSPTPTPGSGSASTTSALNPTNSNAARQRGGRQDEAFVGLAAIAAAALHFM